eukprot:Nk52_evm49s215 gene=Nk52_evmTU49s215
MAYVLVYDGPGASPCCVAEAVKSLSQFLSHKYDVKKVDSEILINEPWEEYTKVLVFPGGRDLPYCKKLNGCGNQKIRTFVENGGGFLAFCAGAYYGSGRVEFEVGTAMEVVGDRELAFFPGVAKGSAYPGYRYQSEEYSHAAPIEAKDWGLLNAYFNGGCYFSDVSKYPSVKSLATYSELNNETCVVQCSVGKGLAILSGVHIEFNPNDMDISDPYLQKIIPRIKETNSRRLEFLGVLLKKLGLDTRELDKVSLPGIYVTPLKLASLHGDDVEEIGEKLNAILETSKPAENPGFHFVKSKEDCKGDASEGYVPVYISDDSPETFHFNEREYFANIKGEFGNMLMYGSVVTSTQSLLEKNFKVLNSIPHGLVFTADRQVNGKGRGGNKWISPEGCLMFSFLLRFPASESVVFLQYVVSLAVVEGVRTIPGYEDIPLRLKWPNDIYLGNENGDGFSKVGGVLVSSNFIDGEFVLLTGCGVNLSNAEPTSCINQAIRCAIRNGNTSIKEFSKEELLAIIMNTFGDLFSVFKNSGFQPLLDKYYKRWLHSGQVVNVIDNSGCSKRCQIEGIGMEFGGIKVKDIDSGEIAEVHPDYNSFDLLKGLVYPKK